MSTNKLVRPGQQQSVAFLASCALVSALTSICLLPTTSSAQELGTTKQSITVHNNCNKDQRSRMERAITVAQTAVVAASHEVRENSPFYRTWFGQWTPGNGEVVRYYLGRTREAWDGLELRCGGGRCDNKKDPPNAFYQPRGPLPSRFTVCHAWHSLPPLSVEAWSNRAGVIVHEVTHGVGLPGTIDVKDLGSCVGKGDKCYGAENARKLARDPTCKGGKDVSFLHYDPALKRVRLFKTSETCKALYNAENYEHFVSDVLINYLLVAVSTP